MSASNPTWPRRSPASVGNWGGLDILVNNAGVGGFVEVADMSAADWHRVIGTNLTGVYHCCHAAIPASQGARRRLDHQHQQPGRQEPLRRRCGVLRVEGGLNAFSEALMQEVRHNGIRVSTVMPGSVRPGSAALATASGTDWKLAPEDVAQVIVDLVAHPARSLPSRVEIRPSRPPRKCRA